MIPDIKELNFPKIDGRQYATLSQATVNIADMGEKTITTQVKIDGDIVPDFSRDWEVEFQGEKYIMPLRITQGSKGNESLKSEFDLTFQHWVIYQLKRWPFVTIQHIAAGTYLPDEEVATVRLNLKDLCILFGQVLDYYYGGAITIDLNPAWISKAEPTLIEISHAKIWDVLIETFYDKYGVRWSIEKMPSRNLLLGTTDFALSKPGQFYNTFNLAVDLRQYAGRQMTISCEYEYSEVSTGAADNTRRFGFELDYIKADGTSHGYVMGAWVMLPENESGLSGSGKFIATVTVPTDAGAAIKTYGGIIQVLDGKVRLWNFKLEAGVNTNPVYSPAPEDSGQSWTGNDGYVIRVGYPTTEVDHIFEYGFEGGLLKVERQVQSEGIRNILKGRGGETNIPFRYFKDTDPNNKDFRPDPDWVVELANISFPNLMPATFRSYVQGWKAAHINQTDADGKKIYAGYTPVGEANAYAPWAYRKGFTDTKFSPVEFVADEITINPETGDRQVEILPGYAPYVKKGSSLDKYGPLPDTLDNDEDIYPTIQGTGLDIAVAVEEIKSDDVQEATDAEAKIEDVVFVPINDTVPIGRSTISRADNFTSFHVGAGRTAIIEGTPAKKAYTVDTHEDLSDLVSLEGHDIRVFNKATGAEVSASGIPEGDYYFTVDFHIDNTSGVSLYVTCSFNDILIQSSVVSQRWGNTFDIWVKNIWDSTKLSTETNTLYAERVWKPVLGDREGNSAKVVFTSGALVHEDYEFTIVDIPAFDPSKEWTDNNGVKHVSHWRITLAKSDAELEATGLYVPSTKKQGKAGDTFAFIGTEMTHVPYVVDAEILLDNRKKDHLGEKKEIKPTFVVTTDRVRLNNEGKPDALINRLRAGNSIRLADKRFIQPIDNTVYETLYLQSITYTYRAPSSDDAALNPDVEIVLGNEYAVSASPISMMQSDISALQRQVGSISNIEQIIRAVCDAVYLRKDGIPERSLSPTQFASLLTSGDFRSGLIGGAGWGIYKDANGRWVFETDRINARQDLTVNTLVVNQAEGRGGMQVDTAAYIDNVTRVDESEHDYTCYFDQKNGTVANLFRVDDVAYCSRWTPENTRLKVYKRRVTAVGADYITLTKGLNGDNRPEDWPDSGANGSGIPAKGDNIIHFGSYTDKTRQYVKMRDVVGGGYERYLEGLDSVNAFGIEYHFVGKKGTQTRWFVGNMDKDPYSGKGDGSYIEYKNGKFNLNNVALSVGSTVGGKQLGEYLDGFDYLKEALKQSTTIYNGLILTSVVSLGDNNADPTTQRTYSGISGLYDPNEPGGGIAAWYGGDMKDKARYYTWDNNAYKWVLKPGADVSGLRIAKGVDRMDGTGYRANGNFWWDETGKLYADPLSFFVGENTVGNVLALFRFYPYNTSTFAQTTAVEPQRIFTRLRIGTQDGQQAVELTYDGGNLKITGGVAAEGDIVALYQGDESGGSGGGLDLAALEAYLTGNGYATQSWVLSQGFITSAQVEAVTARSLESIATVTDANQGAQSGSGYNANGITCWRGSNATSNLPPYASNAWNIVNIGMGGNHGTQYQYAAQLYFGGPGNTFFFRNQLGAPFNIWREVAFTDGNVLTATRLQSARTLWGHPFDGTSDVSGGLTVPYLGGSWITLATRDDIIKADQQQTVDSAYGIMRIKNSDGAAIVLGGLGAEVGFYGFLASRIAENSNGFDWSTVWNVTTGEMTHSGRLNVKSLKIGDGTVSWDPQSQSFKFSHTIVSDGDITSLSD